MPSTIRGVYHNLKESKYAVSNSEIAFFFSSVVYRDKFMDKYQNNRIAYKERFSKVFKKIVFNVDVLADLELYQKIEKRGFRAWVRGIDVQREEIHQYALRKMTEKNTLNWYVMQNLKLKERLKIME